MDEIRERPSESDPRAATPLAPYRLPLWNRPYLRHPSQAVDEDVRLNKGLSNLAFVLHALPGPSLEALLGALSTESK